MLAVKKISILFILTCVLVVIAVPVVSAADGKVNINTATVEELTAGLKNVGPKYAAAIVAYRETVAKFKTPEDIKLVKGIGDKTFEANKDVIVVED